MMLKLSSLFSGRRMPCLLLVALLTLCLLSAAFLLLVIIWPRPPVPEPLLVPSDLARRFNLQHTEDILAYARTEIQSSEYDGILRGAHGALWAGEASAWDQLLLVAEALEAEEVEVLIVPGDPPRLAFHEKGWPLLDKGWMTVRLDTTASLEVSRKPPDDAISLDDLPNAHPELYHKIHPTLILEKEDGTVKRVEAEIPQRVTEWVFRPVVLVVVEDDHTLQYVLRVGEGELLSSGPLVDVTRASLELSWRFQDQTTIWQRELFDIANVDPDIPGNEMVRAGDQYAVVIASGPLVTETLETRQEMLQPTSTHTPIDDSVARNLVMMGMRFLVDSDDHTNKLAEETGVQAAWTSPRVVVAASERIPCDGQDSSTENGDQHETKGCSLDLLADRIEAIGEDTHRFHVARGLANDQIETRVVHMATGVPIVSASTVFAQYASTTPSSPQQRIDVIEAEAVRLLKQGVVGTQLEFRKLPPLALHSSCEGVERIKQEPAPLKIERTSEGLVLHGVREQNEQNNPSARDAWDNYVPAQDSSIFLGDDVTSATLIVEAVLGRQVELRVACENAGIEPALGQAPAEKIKVVIGLDYLLDIKQVSALPSDGLPVTEGSILVYRAELSGAAYRLAVLVSLEEGIPRGVWVDLDSGRHGQIQNVWPEVLEMDSSDPTVAAFLAPAEASTDGEPVHLEIQVGEHEWPVDGRQIVLPDGAKATLLPAGVYSPILAWERGDASLVLESMSPAIKGRVLDADTRLPVAKVTLTASNLRHQMQVAADGMFIGPVTPPLFQRLILIVDRSGSMEFGLDPQSEEDAPSGEQRMDSLRAATHALLDQVPPGVEVSLWSFSTPEDTGRFTGYPDFCSPEYTRVDADFTSDRNDVRRAVDSLMPEEGTPLTGAVIKAIEHIANDPLSQGAVVVLLSDGINSCEDQAGDDDEALTAAEAYLERRGTMVVHTVGFAIEPGGIAEQELESLAEVSGGSYHLAGTGEELSLVFEEFAQEFTDLTLEISAPGYGSERRTIHTDELGATNMVTFELRAQRTPGLLTVRLDNVTDLDRLEDLSPKARQMIEERVRDDTWSVTIPTERVNIGGITAYGWFEYEQATGRIRGRTEDGLYGSVADPFRWPRFKRGAQHPFIAWYQGIVAYTTGSIVAALDWHNQPGFLSGSPEDFERFIQANALEFSVAWWFDVGYRLFNAKFAPHYFSGVCLNFEMQCAAFQNTGCDQCLMNMHKYWARDICQRTRDDLKRAPDRLIREQIVKDFRAEWDTLSKYVYKRAKAATIGDLEEAWNGIVDTVMPCDELFP